MKLYRLLLFSILSVPFFAIGGPHPDALPNTHLPGEVDVPANVKYIVKDPAKLKGIVLDETAAKLVGEWQYSTHTPPYVGIGYLHDRKEGKGKKSVTWTLKLPESGEWEVRISHCFNIRRATNTPVTIVHSAGSKTIRINQQEVPEHGNLFRSLGTYHFDKAKAAKVIITNDDTNPKKVVIADAVQFLKLD